MKLFKVAALAALVVSGSALAFPFHQADENSQLKIYQNGSANHALALQSNAMDSKTDIKQLGANNGADVGQGSDDSSIDLLQSGYANNATLDQWNGEDSKIDVRQYGSGNGALVDQTASGSTVEIQQVGYGNNASAFQY